jgi:hypothetical protein
MYSVLVLVHLKKIWTKKLRSWASNRGPIHFLGADTRKRGDRSLKKEHIARDYNRRRFTFLFSRKCRIGTNLDRDLELEVSNTATPDRRRHARLPARLVTSLASRLPSLIHFASLFYIIIYCYSLMYFIFRDDTYVVSYVFTCLMIIGGFTAGARILL